MGDSKIRIYTAIISTILALISIIHAFLGNMDWAIWTILFSTWIGLAYEDR